MPVPSRRVDACAVPALGLAIASAFALSLAACTSPPIDAHVDQAREVARAAAGADLRWWTSEDARRQARTDVDARLARPLDADGAVQVALSNSAALQALLFQRAAESAASTQAARLPNPVIAFERLARGGSGAPEVEVTRSLALPLLELIALPARRDVDAARQRAIGLQLARDVLRVASEARVAWIRAVAARQSAAYAAQVETSAAAGADLAQRMQDEGHFSALQRRREQLHHADAVTQVALARAAERSAREALVRALGLDADGAARLQIPDHLPDVPATARPEADGQPVALDRRLDVQIATAELERVAREQGWVRTTSWVDGLDLDAKRVSTTGQGVQRGVGVELRLPVFDPGDAARAGAQAAVQAAMHRASATGLAAASEVRVAVDGWRTRWTLARHLRDEVVPLQQAIAAENLRRYNGMLIGVFDLLAGTREQIAAVMQAQDAQRDFWLADAALRDAIAGVPSPAIAGLDAGPGNDSTRQP